MTTLLVKLLQGAAVGGLSIFFIHLVLDKLKGKTTKRWYEKREKSK